MMWYNGPGPRMMGFGWGWLVMIAIFVLVILGILALGRYLRQSRHYDRPDDKPASKNPAISILNERYAKGELSDEEYIAKKAQLNK